MQVLLQSIKGNEPHHFYWIVLANQSQTHIQVVSGLQRLRMLGKYQRYDCASRRPRFIFQCLRGSLQPSISSPRGSGTSLVVIGIPLRVWPLQGAHILLSSIICKDWEIFKVIFLMWDLGNEWERKGCGLMVMYLHVKQTKDWLCWFVLCQLHAK